jgi:hypothetical protein
MVAVLILGGGLGWIIHHARVQQEAVAAIERAGGSVLYNWQYKNGSPFPSGKPRWPKWLVDRIGVNCFGNVVFVFLTEHGTDVELAHVGRLSRLERLQIRSPSVTDGGIAHLKGLTSVQNLIFIRSAVSDTGLSHLKRTPNLSKIRFSNTLVTDAGLAEFQRALPKVQIGR